ncbi:hypothetical protein BC826DRAFT_1150085 [Russula brevipes]|nr:hypothetical protein BC826DRAFT_1150085 [Russula brevipes]
MALHSSGWLIYHLAVLLLVAVTVLGGEHESRGWPTNQTNDHAITSGRYKLGTPSRRPSHHHESHRTGSAEWISARGSDVDVEGVKGPRQVAAFQYIQSTMTTTTSAVLVIIRVSPAPPAVQSNPS